MHTHSIDRKCRTMFTKLFSSVDGSDGQSSFGAEFSAGAADARAIEAVPDD